MTQKVRVARQMEAALLNPRKQVIQLFHWAKAQKRSGIYLQFLYPDNLQK